MQRDIKGNRRTLLEVKAKQREHKRNQRKIEENERNSKKIKAISCQICSCLRRGDLGTQRHCSKRFLICASGEAILRTQRYISKQFILNKCSCLRRSDFRYTTTLFEAFRMEIQLKSKKTSGNRRRPLTKESSYVILHRDPATHQGHYPLEYKVALKF